MIVESVERFVTCGEGNFDELALAAFAFQLERIEPYRRLVEARGVTPRVITSWWQIPPVPAAAFKTLKLAAAPEKEVFRSSGTTGTGRGVHYHPFPELYRAVIDATFPRYCLSDLDRPPMLSLIPDRELLPDSSLSFMIDHVVERFGGKGSLFAFGKKRVEIPRARSWLGARQRDGRPGLVLATAFALGQLLDGLERLGLRFRLPAGSTVFETGGFKGRSREIAREELLERVEERLDIPPSRVVGEYGMTELTSQCYTRTLSQPESAEAQAFVPPPWMRVRVVDPRTLGEVPAGSRGLLCLFDLANLGSALHLLTEDLARTTADGRGFYLAGRAAGAELRGCSLSVEEMEAG